MEPDQPMHDPWISAPVEVILAVFCHLPTFSEALNFATTCHRHYRIWIENTALIYTYIAPKSIPCIRHARDLLAAQGGAPVESGLITAWDIRRLIRNWRIVQKSLARFNQDITPGVKSKPSQLCSFPWAKKEVF
ncbi:hypothetical protein PHISCL_04477 [Aspergillus sclerotialis]|uniref:F-box domain-containing protein n=1 Tax=Aspergillus sclerotialis TaxID=2070753 RepID=A0A3A2ZKU4_9EURO|nr:hypothetical protein PHISCL_04477 [Aspergillus sclerotialis]